MNELKKKKLNYFHQNQIISLSFGSTHVAYKIYDLRTEKWEWIGYNLAACLFKYDLFESYDDYEFISIGWEAERDAWEAERDAKDNGVFYVDQLSNKIEYLFDIEPNIKKLLKHAKDRLYQRAVVQYVKSLIEKNVYNCKAVHSFEIIPSKCRYLVTYPAHWTLEQAAYLRSLLHMAYIVDGHDHPDRLIMYNEDDAIIRCIQSPLFNDVSIREGQKCIICDLNGSKVEMRLYDIKGSINPQSLIKSASRCNWYNGSIKEPAQIYIRKGEYYPETILYLSSLFSSPSISFTVKDMDEMLDQGQYSWKRFLRIEDCSKGGVEENAFFPCDIPKVLLDLYYERLSNVKESSIGPLPQWMEDKCINIYQRDIKEKVLKLVCNRIIQYIDKIIETVTDIDVNLVICGNPTYFLNLIADEYKKVTNRKVYIFPTTEILDGALLKYLDLATIDIYKPKIVHGRLDLSDEYARANTQDVIILIDYESAKTQVSFIHAQPGQIAGDANIKRIMNWPSQSILNCDFPSLNVILFPEYPLNIGKNSKVDLWRKRNLFSNFLSGSNKAMLVLQVNDDYNQKIASLANRMFYTFEKDEYGIILVTHKRKKKRKIVSERLIATTTTNSTTSSYEVTRKRISFQEFTLLYFTYLADFLHTYIYSKTGIEKNKYRYCITHDNQGYPGKFTLSNKDIRQVALESNLISADIPTNLLVLERAEASAIYCRKLIDTTMINGEAHLYFVQVQLHPDRLLLILNTVPLVDPDDSNSYRENGKLWECVHKYAETKNIPINFMDIVSENLWIHMQKIGSLLLRKCEQHQVRKQFFNSKNMQTIKNMLYDYISITKDLNLEDSEKENTIQICDKDPGSCCYLVMTNMDLLEFGFNPAIDQLVSIIQNSIFNHNLFQGIQVSDIFVMGEFLNCQDYASYEYLEELLLTKLKNIRFPGFDNIILRSMITDTQVRKLDGREHQQGQDGRIENRYDSLAQISSKGSIMFGINPRNLLVERIAARTYIIKLVLFSKDGKLVYKHQGRTLNNGDTQHVIILKGTPLNFSPLIEDAINIMITECHSEDFRLLINLFAAEDDVSYMNDTNMDENNWRNKFWDSNFENLIKYGLADDRSLIPPVFSNKSQELSYPFSFKFRFSLTKGYLFWDERGKNSKDEVVFIREPILLKSCHNE